MNRPNLPPMGKSRQRLAFLFLLIAFFLVFFLSQSFWQRVLNFRDVSSGIGAAVWLRIHLLCVRVPEDTVTV
jgi:hypothetical protein